MRCNLVINQQIKSELMEKLRVELPVLRARLGISQERAAEIIGISRQTYNAIETVKREMTWPIFLSMVAFFQNNEQTDQMLKQIDEFEEKMRRVLNSESLDR